MQEKNENINISCCCEQCKFACGYRPGWFLPQQIPMLKKRFNVEEIRDMLGENKLAIDWWNDDHEDILILAPNIIGNTDIQYPRDPRAACIFFKNDRCSIYNVRPFECAVYFHDQEDKQIHERHKYVAMEWRKSDLLKEFSDSVVTYDLPIWAL